MSTARKFLVAILGMLAFMTPQELSAIAQVRESLNGNEAAIKADPSNVEAHRRLAVGYLSVGDYQRGWEEFEWRLPSGNELMRPKWDGRNLRGQKILVVGEGGFGDVIMFARYASLVKGRGGRVLYSCDAKLRRLFRKVEGIDAFPEDAISTSDFVCHINAMGLPRLLKRYHPLWPGKYLSAERPLIDKWRVHLAQWPGMRVGIAWQGSPTFSGDNLRSIPLRHFAPLAAVPGVRLISLQKGFGSEQLAGNDSIIDLGQRLDNHGHAFIDTAAVMETIDLVITSDTSIAHLAGALNRPVWLATQALPFWVWGLSGETTPWYPSMRIFRQTTPGDWAGVFERIAGELRKAVA